MENTVKKSKYSEILNKPKDNVYEMRYSVLVTDKENKTEHALLTIQDLKDILSTFSKTSYLVTRVDKREIEAHDYQDYVYIDAPEKIIDIIMEDVPTENKDEQIKYMYDKW